MRRAVIVAILATLAIPAAAHQGSHGEIGIVMAVIEGSPAAAAGLMAGDRLTAIDGRILATRGDLQAVMEAHTPGDTVPLAVVRDGEPLELTLTFGERQGGGVSIGIRISLGVDQGADGEGDRNTAECLAWIDATYRIESLMKRFGLDLSEAYDDLRKCVGRDIRLITLPDPVRFCDNIFKVHCSGVDLLTEIGEAQVEWCASRLGASLGMRPGAHDRWKRCAESKVFERYAMRGESSDEDDCRAVLLDDCGVEIDTAIGEGRLSPEQQEFAECCRADRFERERDADPCRMIDPGFTRGPCHDFPICINRLNGEWLHCREPR